MWLFWPVSQIDIQRIVHGFLMESHIYQEAILELLIVTLVMMVYECVSLNYQSADTNMKGDSFWALIAHQTQTHLRLTSK